MSRNLRENKRIFLMGVNTSRKIYMKNDSVLNKDVRLLVKG